MNLNFNNNSKTTRDGFTLIELLFVIAIIAVLGAMAAGILGKAKKDAQIAATRSRITQIEALMQTVSENFEVRRLPFRNADLAQVVSPRTRTVVSNVRRRIVAALMLAEFPLPLVDANGDFIPNPELGQLAPSGAAPIDTFGINFREWAEQTHGAGLVSFLDNLQTAETTYWASLIGNPDLAEPGEYLYLILQRINIDGISALEALGPNVVGNPDNDSIPDIVDAFGESMQLRIVQVAVTDTTLPGDDVWTDVAESQINWKLSTDIGNGIEVPNGYQILNTVIPRSINKIRFQVVSPKLEEIE